MGFMDAFRHELVDIVEWIDDPQHTLVWRFPRYRNEIKHGAKLIVRPGQVAVFVSEGRIADSFEPGTHSLETRNLPILRTILSWPYGFESPFKSEVYFVSTRQITGLKWGTPNPILLRDPDFGPIRLRAFGTYNLRCTDAKVLLEQLVGTDGVYETDEVNELVRSVIVSAFADVVGAANVAALDLASKYQELADQVRQRVASQLGSGYGLDLPALYVVNVSLPEEVEKALDARSSIGVLGDMGRYQQYQMGRAMVEAAQNPAGGGASEGVGLGMGFAMAQQMASQMAQQGAGAAGVPPPPPGGSPAIWFLAEQGRSLGPFTATQLAELAAAGRLRRESHLWRAGFTEWRTAAEVPEVGALFGPPPPPGA
jgi:membrane protease subunit (stomatin/prohibitin family)